MVGRAGTDETNNTLPIYVNQCRVH